MGSRLPKNLLRPSYKQSESRVLKFCTETSSQGEQGTVSVFAGTDLEDPAKVEQLVSEDCTEIVLCQLTF